MPHTFTSVRIKNELIASVKDNFPVKDVIIGLNLTAVESKNLGMASTVFDKKTPFIKIEQAGRFMELSVLQLINKLHSQNPLEASLGMAAFNSLIEVNDAMQTMNAYKIIEEKAQGKNIGVVGHFPFVERLKKISHTCWVFEKRPREGDRPAAEIPELLPQCDVVVITGQSIINGSIEIILKASPQAFKIMLGPSTPLSPVLFDFGIDVVGGTFIQDKTNVKKFISQAAHYRELNGLQRLVLKRESNG